MIDYKNVAVLIPCRDEAETISQVVDGFKAVLPNASIYVYDNCSTDDTQKIAKNAGFEKYRDYMFPAMGRFDYTPEDCFNFHNSILIIKYNKTYLKYFEYLL